MSSEPHPDFLTPTFLTDALRRSGALGAGSVRSFTVESASRTILSRIVRLSPTYEGVAEGAPRALVLKTGVPERMTPAWEGGRNEVAFYRTIAPAVATGLLIRCFDAGWNAETGAWHLLLEDITDTHKIATTWPLPPPLRQCELIIEALAGFHAAWWDDRRLGVSVGTLLDETTQAAQQQQFAERVASVADRVGDLLPPRRRAFYERFVAAWPRLFARYRTHRHLTIVHGDAHVWNAFLPHDSVAGGARLFDWDCWRVDVATDDLAYMMAMHWYPDRRRICEASLLDRYHATLLAHGVCGYDRTALDADYRLSVLWQLATPIWQAATGIPPLIWWNNLERILLAVDDLGCEDLLRD